MAKKRNFKRRTNFNNEKEVRGKRDFSSNRKGSKFVDDYHDYSGDKDTNDPSWYAKYPELMIDSASIPYSIPTGTEISWDVVTDPSKPLFTASNNFWDTGYMSVPGIMTLGLLPTPGVAVDATSPINVASDMLYTKVRAENSGARNYDSPDLMLYCLAMDQIYSLITWYNRIYGTLMLYAQGNRYFPKALLQSQHVNFDDLLLHINDFKAFIDTATAQAAVFSVPADMSIFRRHAFLFQNVYKDAESTKSQLYQFAPRGFYKYNEVSGAGKLEGINVITTFPNGMNFSDLVALFHMLMDPIISSEDFNIMSGDILKAFGESNLLKLQIMPQGYTIVPIADYEVLTQIKNATISNLANIASLTFGTSTTWDIAQDPNVDYIIYNPQLTYGTSLRANFSRDRYLSTYKTTPTPADNMVYTRLMFATKEVDESTSGSTNYVTYFDAVGSEFVVAATITLFTRKADNSWQFSTFSLDVISDNNITLNMGAAMRVFIAKHFDFCPCIYMFAQVTNNTYFYPIFDLDNWTIVHAYELEKMHRTALMSMFRVPMIGSALPSNYKA